MSNDNNDNSSCLFLLLLLLCSMTIETATGQFNEPPGQRREQTFRILEYELSSINQHYPGDLRYYCTFRGKWSEERHPFDFPSAASWSAPTLVSHSKNYRMWTGTETVTAGVEYIAEDGYPTILYNEFSNAGFETLQMIVGERMFNTTETQELPPINVTYSHPMLSSMVKVTPSPDWFVGFSDLRTISYDTETYYNRIVIQSYVWDSGTDDGQNYLSFDRDLDPQVVCSRFCVPPYFGGGGVGTKDANIVHHPNGNSHTCPDLSKGRVSVPANGQFLDYTQSYIPYLAEFECVLRVGDGEVYAGNEFNESQIRPEKYISRPDDDFVDGLSPYDYPAYDEHMYDKLHPPVEIVEEEEWNKHWLWIPFVLFLCWLTCGSGVYLALMTMKYKKHLGRKSNMDDEDEDENEGGRMGPHAQRLEAEQLIMDEEEYDEFDDEIDDTTEKQHATQGETTDDDAYDDYDNGDEGDRDEGINSGYFNYENVDAEYYDVRAKADADVLEADDEDYASYLDSQRISEESQRFSAESLQRSSSASFSYNTNNQRPNSSRTTSYRDFV